MKHRPQFSSTEREMQPKKAPDVHWNKCFRYKEDLAENLRCPLNAKSDNAQESYTSLLSIESESTNASNNCGRR